MYGRNYRSKASAGKKRKQYRKRTTTTRRRTGMRKNLYTRNKPVALSAEKKYIEHGITNQPFAQVSGILQGYYVINTTPNPQQGLGQNARIGQKIFCTGSIMDVQFTAQASTINAIKYRYYVVRIPDAYDTPGTDIVPFMFDTNPWNSTSYDWHSNIDPENKRQFKVIATGSGTMKPDQITGQTAIVQFRRYLKLGWETKWDVTTSQAPSCNNQWRLILFADTGDLNTQTGLIANVNFRTFYLDN